MAKKTKYRALKRLRDAERRLIAEPGQVTDKIPATSIPWLLEQGYIEPVTAEEE